MTAYYVKQAIKKNDKILTVSGLNELELLNAREDRWPCSPFRKRVRRISIHIGNFAASIIKRKSFEAVTILVIMANCITLTMSKADSEPTETEVLIENIF